MLADKQDDVDDHDSEEAQQTEIAKDLGNDDEDERGEGDPNQNMLCSAISQMLVDEIDKHAVDDEH